MDKDRIKGKAEELAGRVQRRVGEWTGDKKTQAEGMKHQVKGKARQAIGKVKDAGREAADQLKEQRSEDIDRDPEKDEAA
jgi:uncharacterized protein YjbJ (UPF0337 family)